MISSLSRRAVSLIVSKSLPARFLPKARRTHQFLSNSISERAARFQIIQRLYSSEINKWTNEELDSITKGNKMVVFMKGTPDAPQCGFSKYVIQILYMHGFEDYKTLNVLDDLELRNRIKEYSEWPTIPQIYMNGEFVGGFDIMLQMHQNGELIDELMKIGHRSVLIDADKEKH